MYKLNAVTIESLIIYTRHTFSHAPLHKGRMSIAAALAVKCSFNRQYKKQQQRQQQQLQQTTTTTTIKQRPALRQGWPAFDPTKSFTNRLSKATCINISIYTRTYDIHVHCLYIYGSQCVRVCVCDCQTSFKYYDDVLLTLCVCFNLAFAFRR